MRSSDSSKNLKFSYNTNFVKPDQKCRTCITKSESMMKENCF